MSTIKTDNENLVLHAEGIKDVEIQTNGSTKLTVKSNGNVGIGTSSPASKLHIGGVGEQIRFDTTGSAGSAEIQIVNDYELTMRTWRGAAFGVYAGNSNFRIQEGTVTRLKVDAGGNVGIGTSSPSDKFVVNGGADGSSVLTGRSDGGIGNNERFKITAFSNGGGAGYGGGIGIQTRSTSNIFSEAMRIDSDGIVTTPYQPHWHGGLTNTSGAGIANAVTTNTSRGGLNFVNDRVTVPVTGVYAIHFNTLSDYQTGRVDANIYHNGTSILAMLTNNTTGYQYKSGSITVLLAANDFIQFSNNDWYSSSNSNTDWKSASVTLIS